jgi:hypothetical protein
MQGPQSTPLMLCVTQPYGARRIKLSLMAWHTVRDGSKENLNRIVAVCRKAAKRTLLFDLAAGMLRLLSSQPQAEDVPARMKRRLEEPFPHQQTKLLERLL